MESSEPEQDAATPAIPEPVAKMKAARRPVINWHKKQVEGYTRGDRAADVLRDRMGSWGFVIGFLVFMAVWAAINVLPIAWDPYPFILLNLFLSMLAGLQGAILLIAAKRQDAVASALSENDYQTNLAAKTDIEALIEMNKRQLELIEQLHTELKERG